MTVLRSVISLPGERHGLIIINPLPRQGTDFSRTRSFSDVSLRTRDGRGSSPLSRPRPRRPTSTGSTSARTPAARTAARASTARKFDNATGKLSEPELAAEMGSPRSSRSTRTASSSTRSAKASGKEAGRWPRSRSTPRPGSSRSCNEEKSGGTGPCHISVSPKGTYAVVANYGGGSTAFFKLGADGKLGKRTAFIQHKGSRKDPAARRNRTPTADSSTPWATRV